MGRNAKVDDYISKSADFAQPILIKLRALVHQSYPDIEETIKWGMPNFEYKGLLFNMASFKEHCSFGFWKQKLIPGLNLEKDGMGSLGKIKSLQDLPSDDVLLMFMKEALILNEKGIKVEKTLKTKNELVIPSYFTEALKSNLKAKAVFDNFSVSQQKEYVEWITEAKREETRVKRMCQMIEWLEEGKRRNWKYENC